MTLIYLFGGLAFLFVGGDALIRGAVALGRHFELSPLAIGMIIVGFGTSVPELVVCLDATLGGHSAMAVGNVVGSNLSNILLILAVAALVSPIGKPARLLMPDGYVLLAVSALVIPLGLQAQIPRWQGMSMVILLITLVGVEYFRARRDAKARKVLTAEMPLPTEVPRRPLVSSLLVITGISGVLYGAHLLVAGATDTARYFGVTEGLIGLTIVAVGTSLPELASSIAASWRGHSEVCYGNIVGSNLFNILATLGSSAAVGFVTIPQTMLIADIPVMIAATGLMLYFLSTGKGLSRPEAAIMLVLYIAYVAMRFGYGLWA